MPFFRIKVFFAILCCFTVKIKAQNLPYTEYTTHDGLPHIQVQKVYQDSKGYIWACTKSGLAKFNGDFFTNYNEAEYIHSLFETNEGKILFETDLGHYLYNNDTVVRIGNHTNVSDICKGSQGYWVFRDGCLENYICRDLVKKIETNFTSISKMLYDKYANSIYMELPDRNIYKYDETSGVISFIDNNKAKHTKEVNGKIFNITTKKEGNNVIISIYDPFTIEEYISITVFPDNTYKYTLTNKLPIDNYIFLIDFYMPIIHFTDYGQSCKTIEFPIKKVGIFDIIMDKDNNYWVASDYGLYYLTTNCIKSFSKNLTNFWTIIKGDDNKLYGGIYLEGLFEIDTKNQTKKLINSPYNSYGKETEYYFSASKDKKGRLFFPSQYGLVMLEKGKTKRISHNICVTSKYDSISNQIIFGTENGIGMIDEKMNIRYIIDSTKTIIPTRPSCFEFTKDGDIFIGSSKSFSYYNRKYDYLHKVSSFYKDAPDGKIVCMKNDYKNNLWIGTTAGLILFDNKDKTFRRIADSIFRSYVLSVKPLDNKYLFVGTSFEIYIIDLKEFYNNNNLRYKMFNYRNGFIGQEIAQDGFFIDGNLLYVPSITNTSVLNIDEISFDDASYNLYITKVNNINISVETKMKENVFHLDKNENRLEIDFEAVGFGMPTATKYSYILEGYDNDWSEWDMKSKAIYTNLKSGKYKFKVRANKGSRTDTHNIIETDLDLRVKLSFYKEPNFYQFAFLSMLFLLAVITFLLQRSYRNRIEKIKNVRKAKYHQIALLQAQMNPHFIFNFLSSVQSMISEQEAEKANEYLVKFSRLMRNYMESSIQNSKMHIGSTVSNDASIAEEIELIKLYIDLEKMKYPPGKLNYNIECENSLLPKPIPPLLLQPLVENAIKHGIIPKDGNGNIDIIFEEKFEKITCTISDDGIGRKQAEMNKNKFIKANKSRGLELIFERIKALNDLGYQMTIEFKDNPNGGTTVILQY